MEYSKEISENLFAYPFELLKCFSKIGRYRSLDTNTRSDVESMILVLLLLLPLSLTPILNCTVFQKMLS